MKKRFRILSPDGFDIRMDKLTYTESQLQSEIKKFVKRYESQGHYSSRYYGRIPLVDIADYCSVEEIEN
jgi:hypothetical protein